MTGLKDDISFVIKGKRKDKRKSFKIVQSLFARNKSLVLICTQYQKFLID